MRALTSLAVALLCALVASGQGRDDRNDSTQGDRQESAWEIKGKPWPQLKMGMTREEVEQVLGPRWTPTPGDNRTPTVYAFTLPEEFPAGLSLDEVTVRLWLRDDSAVFVGFDPHERVCLIVPSGVYHRKVAREEGIQCGPFSLPHPEKLKVMQEADPFQ
jgi:hypothetical protein